MEPTIQSSKIPGTVFDRDKMGGVTGEKFLSKIFFVTDGIMLGQIREITGVDGTTLQTWVKRGWLPRPQNKLYRKDQLARILMIHMMRDTMQLSKISFLLHYINGRLDDTSDDIITDSDLYDYICRLLDLLVEKGSGGIKKLPELIRCVTSTYVERRPGAGERLNRALEVIMLSCWASLLKGHVDALLKGLEAERTEEGYNA